MTINKLPSGNYRIRQMVHGKTYSITIDHKPRKFEAEELMHDLIYGQENTMPYIASVGEKAEHYIIGIKGKSPTTINSYKSIVRNTPVWFLDLPMKNLTTGLYQKMVDEYSHTHSPKSTHNLNGFYKCVFADLSHLKNYSTKLPKKIKKAEYEPTTKDVKAILEYCRGSRYECVLNLACIGLRRGEAVAITSADLDGNVLTINKDLVYDGKGYVLKDHPKTQASNRRILIPDNIADMIRTNGIVFDGNPHTINAYLHRVQKELGIPSFRLHILRHFAGACLHKNGLTDRQIMAYMGWDTITTMHQVYNYNLDPEDTQKDIVDAFASFL